ncbi:MAG: class I SAM-dependent methyltransferase [Candidatus Dormibacteria bacterium]
MTARAVAAPTGDAASWDRRYRERSWPSDPDELVTQTLSDRAPGRALDLGCGTGRHAIWLAHRGWSVTGVDVSAVGLATAAARAEREDVRLQLVHAGILEFAAPPEGFDLVLLANVHPAAGERRAVLDTAAGSVAPGGHLLLIGHHLDNLGRAGPPDPERLYTVERVRDALPAGLTVELLERVEAPTGGHSDAPDVAVIAWLRRPSTQG